MTELFLNVVNRSYSALWLVLAVVLLRLLLWKVPRWIHAALWGLVAVRLVLPFAPESSLSLQPSAQVISPQVVEAQTPSLHTGLAFVNSAVNPVLSQSHPSSVEKGIVLLTMVWVVGMVLMLAYMVFSYLRLRRRVSAAVCLRDRVFQGEAVPTPFVLGVFQPGIYLPADLEPSDLEHVIAHEQAHIRRKDHWWKPLGFLLLTIHWFNPLLWVAYGLLCRDIELACDEKVIRGLEASRRADYSQSLLRCSVERRHLTACPVAFGEVGVEARVRHVLSYKKPAFWILLAALAAVVVTAVCLLTDPVRDEALAEANNVRVWIDYLDTPEEMNYDQTLETTIPEYPDVTFRYSSTQVTAGEKEIVFGMPIWNVYFVDLTGDGKPEVCATVSYGSGIIDTHVVVADLTEEREYALWERGEYDYFLRMEDGVLICEKREYPDGEIVQSGPLMMMQGSFEPWTLVIGEYTMIPTTANLQGVFDRYLYLERDGQTYRYEQADLGGDTITRGELLDTFTEPADPEDVQWEVYAIEGVPDRTQVLAVTNDMSLFRYVYSPSKAVDEHALQDAKDAGCVVLEDGAVTQGQDTWQEFYDTVQKGEPASVQVASYYTLNPENCDETYYEAYKEDYPALYVQDLVYDGQTYTLSWEENGMPYVREYEYLMRYETESAGIYSHEEPKTTIRYVLTHDDSLTWDDLWQGMISSQFGAYIDHHTIYKE